MGKAEDKMIVRGLARLGSVGICAGALVLVLTGVAPPTPASSTTPATTASTQSQVESLARAEVGAYMSSLSPGAALGCVGPAGNPAPGSPAWTLRDEENQYCATQRLADEYSSPAFGATFWSETPSIFGAQTAAQAEEPGHLHLSLGQLVPGGTTADPFRTLARWTAAGRGRVQPISFTSSDGAALNGYLFEPPAGGTDAYSAQKLKAPYPGVVITTGSIQGYQQMYFWAAEGLAEAGYMVMTYDVQGQGGSDTLPANCSPSSAQLQQSSPCPGVPFQQSYNFYQGAEDALNWFLSSPQTPYVAPHSSATYNPEHADLNSAEVGIAGHSLGAAAVSELAQCDQRVKAVVAWDNLAAATSPCKLSVDVTPSDASTVPSLTTPALGINSEYFLNPEPMTSVPDPHAHDSAYRQLRGAGEDTMQVALRSSMHLEYSYVPYILPASQLGERVAFYYTLAWFDYYLRHMASGYTRLVATTFDDSSDVHSIGAGTYSVAQAATDPTDPAAGNVAYKIAELPVDNRLSFYYESEYSLTRPATVGSSLPDTTKATCSDMRAGCPITTPATP